MENANQIRREKSGVARKAYNENNPHPSLEYGKIPPQAVDLEEAVLGAMMLEQQAINKAIDILKSPMFYKDSHQKIYSAIHGLFSKSEPVDILTVTNELRQRGELEIVGGPYYIGQLTNRISSGANIEFHARIIAQKYIQRELISISSDIIKDAFEDTTDVFELLDKAESNLFEIAENNLRRSAVSMDIIVKEAMTNIEEASKNESNLTGVPTGFHKLDHITAGWQPSDLIILAARPGMGKTAFVLTMARNMAIEYNKAVAIFSLEMASVQLVTRLIASEAEVEAQKLKKGDLNDADWQRLNASMGVLANAKIYIDDTPALSMFELRAKSRRLKAQYDIQMIIIDYLQLMTAGNEKGGNREQEISSISRSLKALAKELNVPIITLSQLNRSVETRGGKKRPQLSDLRESGAIEQDADMVCFIYRPDYYGIEEQGDFPKGYTELIIAKHRNGGLEDIPMMFTDKYARFTNYYDQMESGLLGGPLNPNEFAPISPNQNFENKPSSFTLPSKMNDDPDIPEDTNEHPF